MGSQGGFVNCETNNLHRPEPRFFAVCSPSDAESERFTAPIYTFFGGISWLRRPGICSEDSRHAGQSNYCTLDMG